MDADLDSPLEYGYQPISQAQIPPEMVVSIAQGLIDPDEIATRHKIPHEQWEKLKVWPPFIAAVEAAKADLAANGHTFRVKSKFMAEQLSEELFIQAMRPEATFAHRLSATQFFTRVGGLEPKEEKTASNGEGFSVSININGASTTISGQGSPNAGYGDVVDVESSPTPTGYMIAPLIDPSLFAEMAENREEA